MIYEHRCRSEDTHRCVHVQLCVVLVKKLLVEEKINESGRRVRGASQRALLCWLTGECITHTLTYKQTHTQLKHTNASHRGNKENQNPSSQLPPSRNSSRLRTGQKTHESSTSYTKVTTHTDCVAVSFVVLGLLCLIVVGLCVYASLKETFLCVHFCFVELSGCRYILPHQWFCNQRLKRCFHASGTRCYCLLQHQTVLLQSTRDEHNILIQL